MFKESTLILTVFFSDEVFKRNIPNDLLKIQKFRSSRPHDIRALTKGLA